METNVQFMICFKIELPLYISYTLTTFAIICSSGQTGVHTVTAVETQIKKADVSGAVLAPDQKVETEKQTPSAKGNGCLVGVTIHRAHTETMTKTTATRTTKTLTAGRIDVWIALSQKNLLWATSTTAKSVVLCSLAVLCS